MPHTNRFQRQLLQPGQSRRDTFQRLRVGRICPDAGTTLLVDYRRPEGNVAQRLAGHAVYTQPEYLVFHAEEAVRRLDRE